MVEVVKSAWKNRGGGGGGGGGGNGAHQPAGQPYAYPNLHQQAMLALQYNRDAEAGEAGEAGENPNRGGGLRSAFGRMMSR